MADKEQAELRKRLDVLLQRNENKFCADCGTRGTGWASTNLGVFVCLRCSGIHRHMGTHISKVKSCTLDKWQPEMVVTMERMGNARAKSLYEAKVPSNYPRPTGDQFSLEQWIRKKYEFREFFDEAASSPPSSVPAPVTPALSTVPISTYSTLGMTPIPSHVSPTAAAPSQVLLDLLSPLEPPAVSSLNTTQQHLVQQPQSLHTHTPATSLHPGWNSAPATPTLTRTTMAQPPLPQSQPQSSSSSSAPSLLSVSNDAFDKPKVSNQDILQMFAHNNRSMAPHTMAMPMPSPGNWGPSVAPSSHQTFHAPSHMAYATAHAPGYHSYPSSPAPAPHPYQSPGWQLPPGM